MPSSVHGRPTIRRRAAVPASGGVRCRRRDSNDGVVRVAPGCKASACRRCAVARRGGTAAVPVSTCGSIPISAAVTVPTATAAAIPVTAGEWARGCGGGRRGRVRVLCGRSR